MPSIVTRALSRRARWFAEREFRVLKDESFSIITNDCWAGEIYELAGRSYQTPFIGTLVMGPCFGRILGDLKAALGDHPEPVRTSRYPAVEARRRAEGRHPYPIGRLRSVDAELHFLHYRTWAEATEKWRRRVARVDYDRLLIKMSVDKDEFTDAEIDQFASLPYQRKLLIASRQRAAIPTLVLAPYPEDAVTALHRTIGCWDIGRWITGGSGAPGRTGRWSRAIRYAGWA